VSILLASSFPVRQVEISLFIVCTSTTLIIHNNPGRELRPFQQDNVQIGQVDREEEDSGYEALIYDEGIFYVIRESVQHEDASYHAIVEELDVKDDAYDIVNQCSCEFEFEGDSKGMSCGDLFFFS
jgi:hypothetical protein